LIETHSGQSRARVVNNRPLLVIMTFTMAAIALALYALPAKSQKAQGKGDIPVELLMKPGDLKELTLGKKEAKVVIIEYASMTCGHCAHFHKTVFPDFKKKYIDTGKVYFIMREFPLDNIAAAASMLARCSGDDKTFPLISVLFAKQKDWAFVKGSPIPPMFEIAKQAGFTKERFDACLKDEALLKKILKTRERAATVFGVSSTPTFFINGKRLKGGQALEKFSEIIDPMLEQK